MGRPKKYNSNGEKQKAYNQRLYLNGFGDSFEGVIEYFDNLQKEWSRSTGFKTERREPHYRKVGLLFLVKLDNKIEIVERFFIPEKNEPVFKRHKMCSLDEAHRLMDEVADGKDIKWKVVTDYNQQARDFHRRSLIGDAQTSRVSLGFLFALLDAEQFGYEGNPGHKGTLRNNSDSYIYSRITCRERILGILGDIDFTHLARRDVKKTLSLCLNKILGLAYTTKKAMSVGTYLKRCDELIDTFKIAAKYLDTQYPHLDGIVDFLKDEIKLVIKQNKIKATSSTIVQAEGLREIENYPWIPIDPLKRILDIAWETNTDLFDFIILSLDAGQRPEEMERLVQNPSKYILPDGTFNFQGTGLLSNELLTKKTIGKVTLNRLVNPKIPVVARIILKYFTPKLEPSDFFGNTRKTHFRKIHPELSEYVERSLRTTMGHMLGYCKHAEEQQYKSSYDMIFERMAHVDSTQVIKNYSRIRPDTRKPEAYFKFKGVLTDPQTRENLTRHSPLWDGWLLKTFLEYHKRSMNSDEYEKLLDIVRAETREYLIQIGEIDEEIEESIA